MITIFYDRKNKRIVSSKELHKTNYVSTTLCVDSEERSYGAWLGQKKEPAYIHEVLIADLAYRSEKCPKYMNHDLFTTINDLVFLRLEEE
jgi:hypothetical protein